MATTNDNREQFIKNLQGRIFTIGEAMEIMRTLDLFPTGRPIIWVNSVTGRPVAFGQTNK